MMKFLMILFLLFMTERCASLYLAFNISDEKAHEIVGLGSPDEVKKLIQNGYSINKVYKCNTLLNTAIKSAVYGTQMKLPPEFALEKVKILINEGADVNLVPCPGKSLSPLYWAVSLPALVGNIEQMANLIFDKMIIKGVDICYLPHVISKPCKDVTPEDREKIRKEINSAYTILARHWTPYFMEIIKILVNEGASINGNKYSGDQTAPIHLATMNPPEITIEPLKFLIQQGADINILDVNGNTPLFWAYGAKNDKAIELLKNAGANEMIRNKNGLLYNEIMALPIHVWGNGTDELKIQNGFYLK